MIKRVINRKIICYNISMITYIYAKKAQKFIDKNRALEIWKESLNDKEVDYLSFEDMTLLRLEEVSHLIVTGDIDEIKLVMGLAHQNNISLGIIALPEQKELRRTFDLPLKIEEGIKQALKIGEKKLDILYCNGGIVLYEVVIGDVPPLDEFDSILNGKTYFDRVKIFYTTLKKVKNLKHTQIKITDAKENEVKISAIGMVGIEYNNNTFASKLISSRLSANDGKLSIVILSPTSILNYIGYLFNSLVSHTTFKSLPKSVGYMSSSTFTIETKTPLSVLVDLKPLEETPIHLEVEEKVLALSVGGKFWEQQAKQTSIKDSIKIDHLPCDEDRTAYFSQAIPFLSHATTQQYASLFKNLREESRVNRDFMVLLIFATMIATFGLFINSGSVIIGAMLLAPLMQPIVSLSMGVLRQDNDLQINGIKTIIIGIIAVLTTAGLIALFTPIERLTPEMSGRLSPTILDLFVAMVSGLAAAYAKTNEKVLGSLAGVSIAVALVPPIAVAGIGLGWLDFNMFYSAFLLFLTNLVGIVFSASFMFWLLGFSPFHLAKKGMISFMVIVGVISIPLYSSFSTMKADILVQKTLSNLTLNVGEHEVKLTHIELFHRKKSEEIRCEVIASDALSKKEKKYLKSEIIRRIDKEVEVIVTFRYLL